MNRDHVDRFCSRVCAHVRFSPDHAAITAELTAHLEPERYIGRCPEQVEEFLDEVIRPVLEENKDLLGVKAEINV